MCGSFQNLGCACKNESLRCTAGVNAMIGYTGGQSIVINAKNVLATQSGQTAVCPNGHWEVKAGKGGVAFGCQR